jgi:hypothetical protein
MAVSKQSPAPYTAGSAVINVIRRFRDKGLTAPFTLDVLTRAGVSESLAPRTLQALGTLELIDDKGMPTPTLQKIRVVSEKEYKACIADWIKSVYAEVFQFVDPSKDDAIAIRDAFRAYQPPGQQDRMVALFLALCAEAGLVDESKKSEAKPAARKAISRVARTVIGQRTTRATPTVGASAGLPPALAGLMQSLPANGAGWTKSKRDKFIQTFESVLDFVVPIVEHDASETNDEKETT